MTTDNYVTQKELEELKKKIIGGDNNNGDGDGGDNGNGDGAGNNNNNDGGDNGEPQNAGLTDEELRKRIGLSESQIETLREQAERGRTEKQIAENKKKYRDSITSLAKNEKLDEKSRETFQTMIDKGMIDKVMKFNPGLYTAVDSGEEVVADSFLATAEVIMARETQQGDKKNQRDNARRFTRDSVQRNNNDDDADSDRVNPLNPEHIKKLKDMGVSDSTLSKMILAKSWNNPYYRKKPDKHLPE